MTRCYPDVVNRERILHYLESAGQSVPADRILREVFNIQAPNCSAADKLLKAIIGRDTRFSFSRGLWQAGKASGAGRSAIRTAILGVESAAHSGDPRMVRGAVFAKGILRTFGGDKPVCRCEPGELQELLESLEGAQLAIWDSRALHILNRLLIACALPPWQGETLLLARLARRVFPYFTRSHTPEDLAPKLGLAPPETENPGAQVRFLAGALTELLQMTPEDHGGDFAKLRPWIESASSAVDFTRFAFGPDFLRRLPEHPGIYVMRNQRGDVIYVGKARNLKRRVGSYFTSRALSDPRTAKLHLQLYSLEVIPTSSEVEALLEEMRMIGIFRPRGNVQSAVHEQREFYGRERNLLLLVPDFRRIKAQAYFLRSGSFVYKETLTLGRHPSRKLQNRLRSVYFGARRRKGTFETWEKEIVYRWLAANRRNLNFIDIDEAGTYEASVKRLSDYLLDPDRLSVKVYYR